MYSPRPREMNGRFEGKCFTFVHAIHSDLISRFDVSQRRRIFFRGYRNHRIDIIDNFRFGASKEIFKEVE